MNEQRTLDGHAVWLYRRFCLSFRVGRHLLRAANYRIYKRWVARNAIRPAAVAGRIFSEG